MNDDRRATSGDGALTSSDAGLLDWMRVATGNPRVLVKLEGGRRGDALFLEDGHGITFIASSWNWDKSTHIGTLSLQSDGSATVDDFQAVLNALALRSVRFASATYRTVRPDIAEEEQLRDYYTEAQKKDYYTWDVLVRKSHTAPYVGVQEVLHLKFGEDDRAILSPSEFLVEDFDNSASDVTILTHNLSSGVLQKNDDSGNYIPVAASSGDPYAFRLDALQKGLMAIHLANPVGRTILVWKPGTAMATGTM